MLINTAQDYFTQGLLARCTICSLSGGGWQVVLTHYADTQSIISLTRGRQPRRFQSLDAAWQAAMRIGFTDAAIQAGDEAAYQKKSL